MACKLGCVSAAWVLSTAIGSVLGTAYAAEPLSLCKAKEQVQAYYESSAYQKDVVEVVAKAKAWVDQHQLCSECGDTFVFDIDETLLSDYPCIKSMSFGYYPEFADWCTSKGQGIAIEPVKQLYHQAKHKGFKVLLLTGRPEYLRDITVQNLKQQGIDGWDALKMRKPDHIGVKASVYKAYIRQQFKDSGHRIVFNIGDQNSDFEGDFSGKAFKLPNPMYCID